MISVEHLTKKYGDFTAVDDLSFEIGEGKIYGFLGPNGAGKSTTMNIMTGCLSSTSGSVKVGGFDIFEQSLEAKKLIGYLPEIPPLYMNETPEEYLDFVAEAKGLKGSEKLQQIDRVIGLTGLSEMRHRLISALSKGYKQRVGIAQAIIADPKLIILDEPTVGLDPIQIVEIRELIKSLGEEHTVIFSSHILSEVQALCDEILIISHGKLVAFDTPDNLEKLKTSEISLTVPTEEGIASEILSRIEGATGFCLSKAEGGIKAVIELASDADARAVSGAISMAFAEHRLPVIEMSAKKAGLEEIFLELTENNSCDENSESAADITASETESLNPDGISEEKEEEK